MKILLSPAKSINESCNYPEFTFSTPDFKKEAAQLVRRLKKIRSKDLMELMHVSKDIAELNVYRYKNWYLSDQPSEEVRPAAFLFTGEVYKGLSIENFNSDQLQIAQDSIRILSGMYGLLKPLDLIYPYRLEMGTRLEVKESVNNLYDFWNTKLTKSLIKQTEKEEAVVNLASVEYAKSIQLKSLNRTVITPTFKEFKNGDYKVIMMFAKHARGSMARYIIENNIQQIEDLKGFQTGGYSFDEKLSTENDWVFVR